MTSNLPSSDSADEDYIVMDMFCSSTSSSPQSKEFEFQFSLIPNDEKETTNFPADELFYKGKLLPLHLSPRLQMLQKLLLQTLNTSFESTKEAFQEAQAPSSTPLEKSSNSVSLSESCRVRCELNPDNGYFLESSTELSSFVHNHRKKSWSKKLQLVKNSILGQKLKAYMKSLFSKSDESSCARAAACNVEPENLSKNKKLFGHIEIDAAYPRLGAIMKSTDKEGIHEDYIHGRSSFSGAINHRCLSSSSSNSSSSASSLSSLLSFNSNDFRELKFLKRSCSATEIEGSIEAAIAHCKKSQQLFDSRNISGCCSFPAKNAGSENQHRLDVSSI